MGKMPHGGKAGEPGNPFKKTAGRGSDKARIVDWCEKTGEFFVVRPAGHCFCYVNVAFLNLRKLII